MAAAWGSDATWGASTPWGGPFGSPGAVTTIPPWGLTPPGPVPLGAINPLGTDIRCLADLDPYFALTVGPEALLQDLVHAIETPGLFYADNWGIDIRMLINGATGAHGRALLAKRIQAAWTEDERVDSAQALVDWDAVEERLLITGSVLPITGHGFQFVVAVSQVGVELLSTGTA